MFKVGIEQDITVMQGIAYQVGTYQHRGHFSILYWNGGGFKGGANGGSCSSEKKALLGAPFLARDAPLFMALIHIFSLLQAEFTK